MKRKTIKFKLHNQTRLPKRLIDSVPLSGPADNAIKEILQHYNIECDSEELKKFLKSYGAWDSEDLQDHDTNLSRLIWLSALDCKEQKTTYFYMGE